jgi:hypothetical protein
MEHSEKKRQEIGIYDALLIASWRIRYKGDARALFDDRDSGVLRPPAGRSAPTGTECASPICAVLFDEG